MDALDAIDNRAIYFVEGAGQVGFVTAWGDGFVTNGDIINANGLSDPRPFFQRLLAKPYVGRVRSLSFGLKSAVCCQSAALCMPACICQTLC